MKKKMNEILRIRKSSHNKKHILYFFFCNFEIGFLRPLSQSTLAVNSIIPKEKTTKYEMFIATAKRSSLKWKTTFLLVEITS